MTSMRNKEKRITSLQLRKISPEAVAWRCSYTFRKIRRKITVPGSRFEQNCRPQAQVAQVFPCEICEISRNICKSVIMPEKKYFCSFQKIKTICKKRKAKSTHLTFSYIKKWRIKNLIFWSCDTLLANHFD